MTTKEEQLTHLKLMRTLHWENLNNKAKYLMTVVQRTLTADVAKETPNA